MRLKMTVPMALGDMAIGIVGALGWLVVAAAVRHPPSLVGWGRRVWKLRMAESNLPARL